MLAINFKDVFKDSFISHFEAEITTSQIITTLVYAFLISMFVYFIYKLTTKNVIYSKSFNVSMSLMSIITSAVVLSMQSNITVSLGMVGALSIVRFRTAIKEPRDLLFLFWSVSNGIIIGSQIYSIALILAIVLGIAMLFFDLVPEKKLPYMLVIYHDGISLDKVEKIFKEEKVKYLLKSENISTKENSCIYELRINKNKDFMNRIKKLKGINEINLLRENGEIQY